jgi:hypothetical protein
VGMYVSRAIKSYSVGTVLHAEPNSIHQHHIT